MSDTFSVIEQLDNRGMISLRGDLSSAKLKKAVADVGMPGVGEVKLADDSGVAWMSPDELLIMMPYDQVANDLKKLQKTLSGTHHLLANVSDARAIFKISGTHAREVIAKLSPVDLHPDAFQPGQIRRSRVAQVPAAFWMRDKDTFELVCFRSVAGYVLNLLQNAAHAGAEMNYFR